LFFVSTILGLAVAAAAFIAWYVLRGRNAGPRSSSLPKKKHDRAQSAGGKGAPPASSMKPTRQHHAQPARAKAPAKKNRRRNFKGAAINPCDDACPAAKALASRRYLVEEAPRLPLEGCDRIATCECKYHNYPDRRHDDERRNVYGSLSTVGEIGMKARNKRSGMDRRSSSLDSELDRIEID
jgi:hypothetical protein